MGARLARRHRPRLTLRRDHRPPLRLYQLCLFVGAGGDTITMNGSEHGAGGLWREAADHLHEVKDNMTKEESDALGDAGIQDLLDDARPGRAGTSPA